MTDPEPTATVVRYRVKPDKAQENSELVRAVYAELAADPAPGFRYATFVLDDGLSFVHIALTEAGHEAPLPGLDAFKAFQAGLPERCDEPPQVTRSGGLVGSFGF